MHNILVDNEIEVVFLYWRRQRPVISGLRRLLFRRWMITITNFNVILFSTEDSFRLFFFRQNELGTISNAVDFCGRNKRRLYR